MHWRWQAAHGEAELGGHMKTGEKGQGGTQRLQHLLSTVHAHTCAHPTDVRRPEHSYKCVYLRQETPTQWCRVFRFVGRGQIKMFFKDSK